MSATKIEVPVGLEQLLYLAARDEDVKNALLSDRKGTLERMGIQLRPTEAVTLESISNAALAAVIGRIRPDNPKRRRLMRLVAATATSLAAGTATIGCSDESGGVYFGQTVDDYHYEDTDVDAGPEDTDSEETDSTQ